MNWPVFATWALQGCLTLGVLLTLKSLASLNKSLQDLNLKMVTMITNQENHGSIIADHETRIRYLEKNH